MALRRNRTLGLAIEERAILAAEVSVSSGRPHLRRAAEFEFPEGLSTQEPRRLGEAVGEFLRQNGFSAKDVIIGLPARWLTCKEKTFPPADPQALAGMVRLEAERSFATEAEHLVIDYTAPADRDGSRPILTAAVARERLDGMVTMSRTAGLRPRAVVPTSMVLADRIRPEVISGLTLFLRPHHVELIIRSGGAVSAFRHLSVPLPVAIDEGNTDIAEVTRAITDAVERSVALMPRYGDNTEPDRLVVWDGMGLGAESIGAFGELLSLPAQVCGTLEDLGLVPKGPTSHEDRGRFASAAALALSRLRGDGFPLDFLHSRLEVREKTGTGRRVARAAVLALAAVAAGALYLGEWRREEEELAALRQRMMAMAADIEAAEDTVERVTLARGWGDQRPRFLEPLRELTLSFPAEGRIWITNLAVRGDMRMLVSGKSGEERTVLDLLDRIRRNGSFDGVKLLYMREAGGGARGVAFSMTFDYVGGR